MPCDIFHFKQFDVRHRDSAMKIGTDAILLGAWSPKITTPTSILDIGCGTGVVLMMALQRYKDSFGYGIEIDALAAKEAQYNAYNSPFHSRMKIIHSDIHDFSLKYQDKFDLILSNPPYFESGIIPTSVGRLRARHQDQLGSLSLVSLMNVVAKLLSPSGMFLMISPHECLTDLRAYAVMNCLRLDTLMTIEAVPGKIVRCLTAWCHISSTSDYQKEKSNSLIIRNIDNKYTDDYKLLTAPYLIS